eukprot:6038757-Pyramimonas_sp.AAC.1
MQLLRHVALAWILHHSNQAFPPEVGAVAVRVLRKSKPLPRRPVQRPVLQGEGRAQAGLARARGTRLQGDVLSDIPRRQD